VAHNVVYDATLFIAEHPAGPWPILQRAGGDCSRDFDFHSKWSQDKSKFINFFRNFQSGDR